MTTTSTCTELDVHVCCRNCGCHCRWWRYGDYILVTCTCGTAWYRVRGQSTLEEALRRREVGR
jgi:hypothetical protein